MVFQCHNQKPNWKSQWGPNAWPSPGCLVSLLAILIPIFTQNLLFFPDYNKAKFLLVLASPVSLSPISVLSFAMKLLERFAHVHGLQLFPPSSIFEISTWTWNVNLISAGPATNSYSPSSLPCSPWAFSHISWCKSSLLEILQKCLAIHTCHPYPSVKPIAPSSEKRRMTISH